MWIEQLPNGNYRYAERYTDPLTGKEKKVSMSNTKKNKRVEKEMFIKLHEKIELKLRKSTAKLNFSELTAKWLMINSKQVKPTTHDTNYYALKQVNNKIGSVQLDKLTAAMINNVLLEYFENDDFVYTTVNDRKKLIIRVINYGLEYGYLTDHTLPTQITIPKINVTAKKDEFKYLERYELAALLNQFEEKNMVEEVRLCKLQTLTGMRFNEMVSLDYRKDIDFENKMITISKNYSPSKKEFFLPKNGKVRKIHFNDEAMQLIQEQVRFDQMKMMKSNLNRENTLLFRTNYDNPYPLQSMNKFLKKIELDSNKELTTHIFRHTFISFMIEQGIDSRLIAEHVGHSNTEMIEKVYSHFTEKMNDNLKRAVNSVQFF
ncbi:tyrosine-type recombinase/integrase [Marinilactibacillus psychrotolerans]|uniref:tyrosine-type recombinase/integrase n=1 Tax=Marinilactibacillus psychrotolerans TaxID=191770 RepID=UPI0038838106